jgi:hypothetical protein
MNGFASSKSYDWTDRGASSPLRLQSLSLLLAVVVFGACAKTKASGNDQNAVTTCPAGQTQCGSACIQNDTACCAKGAPCPNAGEECLRCNGASICVATGAICCGGKPCGPDGWRCFLCKGGEQCQPSNTGCQPH